MNKNTNVQEIHSTFQKFNEPCYCKSAESANKNQYLNEINQWLNI